MFNNIFTKGLNIIICWIVFLAWGTFLFQFSVYPKLKELNGNADLPEERFGFTGDYFYNFLDKIGEVGQSSYFTFQLFDYLNGILLGFMLFVTIYYFLNKLAAKKIFKLFLIFPFLLAVFDVLENSIFLYLISAFPLRYFPTINLAGDITNVKFFLGTMSFLILLIIGLIVLFSFIYRKVKSK